MKLRDKDTIMPSESERLITIKTRTARRICQIPINCQNTGFTKKIKVSKLIEYTYQ
jgi:hypothetical protein